MAQVLIRGLSPALIQRWRDRAKSHNRSLEAELRELLASSIGPTPERYAEAVRFADKMRAKTAGKVKGNTYDFIVEERERRAR
jgi:plasmid stability protein